MDMTVISGFLVLLVFLLLGVPVPFSFFAATITIVIVGGYDPSFLIPYGYQKSGSIILIAVPLFILAGGIMERGGIGEKLVDLVEVFFGRFRGGLGTVAVISCALFGAISGSGAATLSCIGSIMFPRLEAMGYPRGHSAALLSSACVLGLLIPPSLSMILYAFVGGVSVLSSFLATVIPGIILVVLMSIVNFALLRNNKNIIITENYGFKKTVTLSAKRAGIAFPALLAPFIILGGIYAGAMTPTEAAAIAVIYAIPVGWFIYKRLTVKIFTGVLLTAGVTSGVILTMLFSVMIMSRLFIMENTPTKIMNMLSVISENPIIIMLLVNLFLIIIGMLMDDTSAILLSTPILLPVVTNIGIDPVHFAAILGVNTGLGCITPPCAPFLYLGARLGNAAVTDMLKPTFALILFAWLPTLLLTTYVPGFAMWLPNLVLGNM